MKVEKPGDIICPALDPEFSKSFQELLDYALNTYDRKFLQELFDTGSKHGMIWVSKYSTVLSGSNISQEQAFTSEEKSLLRNDVRRE